VIIDRWHCKQMKPEGDVGFGRVSRSGSVISKRIASAKIASPQPRMMALCSTGDNCGASP